MKPKISIITVCFNAGKVIERTIKSVLEQTYSNYEYIIVDALSNDSTMDIVNKYKNGINLIISERDRGIYDAMNKGIKNASGDWLIMMNAGDIFSSNQTLENVFSKDYEDKIQCLYSDVYMPSKKGDWTIIPLDFEHGGLIHQSTIYRRKLHERLGMYIVTEKLIISDYLFFVQLKTDEVRKIDTIIAFYEGGGVSSQGKWPRQQSLCADVIFRQESFFKIFFLYVMKELSDFLPSRLKIFLKRQISK
jgi:glycosyltransferase involved in cell wall biosynthesis